MNNLPQITYEQAEELWPRTDYAMEAACQDLQPIFGPDAAAFFIEGYEYARRVMGGQPSE